MRPSRHLITLAALTALLLAAALPLAAWPAPAAAQIADPEYDNFASAVPCLTAADALAVTCFADTIFNLAPSGDPAVVEIGLNTKAALASVGTTNGVAGGRVVGGVGSVYGLAYDDGALSGSPRLFMAAYLKRLSSFGQGGPGGVYAYDLGRRSISSAPLFVVPDAGWERQAGAADASDRAAIPYVGRSGLGDMEISPDGRELFIVNIGARRIERYDITSATPARLAPIAIDDGALDTNDALDAIWAPRRDEGQNPLERPARADTVPFALEFSPLGAPDSPLLVLGLTDTGRRFVQGGGAAPPTGYPGIHLATYSLRSGTWLPSLSQRLDDPAIRDRQRDSQIAGLWASTTLPSTANPYSARGLAGWNPWHDALDTMPSTVIAGLGATAIYPQPLLTDIEFTHDGRRMYLGLRDRTGDITFAAEAPAGERASIAQGDTLVYDLRGPAWALQTTARTADPVNSYDPTQTVRPAPSDVFNDNRHFYDVSLTPIHIENHGGALATTIQGDGRTIEERVAITSLLGSRRSGVTFYADEGGSWTSAPNVLITATRHAGGKSAVLGDLEPLCTYAFVSGRVWDDVDGEGDQDATGEPGIAGVILEAFRGDASTAPALATATTDADGVYRFALPPNTDFRIRINAAQRGLTYGKLAGFHFSPHNRAGGDDTRDSDASEVWGFIELAGSAAVPQPGETGAAIPAPTREQELSDVDIGLTRVRPTGVIGDQVWLDYSRNGLFDTYKYPNGPTEQELVATDEIMRALGITLVSDPSTATFPPQSKVVRLPGGRYEFQGLPPGRYAVHFSDIPAGYSATIPQAQGGANDAIDSDAPPSLLTTRFVTLASPTYYRPNLHINRNLDLGLIPDVIDLAITMTATSQVLPGGVIDYTLSIRNVGANPSRRLSPRIELYLGPGIKYASADGSPIVFLEPVYGYRLWWPAGDVPVTGEPTELKVRAYAPPTMGPSELQRELIAAARVSIGDLELRYDNNSANVSTLLVRPELALEKLGPAEASVGDEVVYTLRVANRGSAAATGVALEDRLPDSLAFVRWQGQPPAGCAYSQDARLIRCSGLGVPTGGALSIPFVARVEPAAPATVTNSAGISYANASDNPADNQASVSTRVLRANPGVEITIVPDQPEPHDPDPAFPVGTRGSLRVRYANGLLPPPAGESRGPAQSVTLSITLAGANYASMARLPSGCSRTTGTMLCFLGTLPAGASGSFAFPITLPADAPVDRLQATATIATTSPELPSDQGDNSSTAGIDVVRPNVFVDAEGPATIVGRGSVFWYSVDYGNIYRRSPALTRRAAGVVLRVTLPAEVTLVGADVAPGSVSGRTLTWELGDLAPRATGRIIVAVQTAAGAGSALRLDAAISTTTPGDSPADNADSVLTDVVQPPSRVGDASGDLRLAISSELDPRRSDPSPDNGVYLTEGPRFAWPAGEAVDLTPRLTRLAIDDEAELPYPYAYTARVVGWSLKAVSIDGRALDPAAADSRGRSGCRAGVPPAAAPRLLEGCAYGYVDGASIEAIRRAALPREEQLLGQARLYWTRPPAPPLGDDIYAYAATSLATVRLTVQVELELQIVNVAPGEIGGIPLPPTPVGPELGPVRQRLAQSFEVTLLVPRTVVGPAAR